MQKGHGIIRVPFELVCGQCCLHLENGVWGLSAARIGLALIREAEQIVRAGLVKLRQTDQHFGWDIVLAGFVFGVAGLRHAEKFRNLRLIHVAVFSEIAKSRIHFTSPGKVFHNLKQIIAL